MRRLVSNEGRRGTIRDLLVGASLVLAATLLGALPAAAASFDSTFGFQPGGLEALPSFTIDESVPFPMAGEAGAGSFAVELTGTTDICLFTTSSPVCQSNTSGVAGAYSVFVTFEITAVNDQEFEGPFTLLLTGLNGTAYAASEVTVDLASTVPSGLDVSGISGFNPRPFVRVIDETYAPGTIYNYIGWTAQLGDTISFRYDVSSAPGARSVPQLTANAVPPIVPEPGTGILMGLGLVGLAMGNRRLASTRG